MGARETEIYWEADSGNDMQNYPTYNFAIVFQLMLWLHSKLLPLAHNEIWIIKIIWINHAEWKDVSIWKTVRMLQIRCSINCIFSFSFSLSFCVCVCSMDCQCGCKSINSGSCFMAFHVRFKWELTVLWFDCNLCYFSDWTITKFLTAKWKMTMRKMSIRNCIDDMMYVSVRQRIVSIGSLNCTCIFMTAV